MFTPYTLNPEQDWLHLRGALRGARWLQLQAQAAPCFLAMLKTKGFIEPKGSMRDFEGGYHVLN